MLHTAFQSQIQASKLQKGVKLKNFGLKLQQQTMDTLVIQEILKI